jgi:hypothetical protein
LIASEKHIHKVQFFWHQKSSSVLFDVHAFSVLGDFLTLTLNISAFCLGLVLSPWNTLFYEKLYCWKFWKYLLYLQSFGKRITAQIETRLPTKKLNLGDWSM